jgi:hypothetical protein
VGFLAACIAPLVLTFSGRIDLIFGRIDMTFSGRIDALRLLTKLISIWLEASAFEESCP